MNHLCLISSLLFLFLHSFVFGYGPHISMQSDQLKHRQVVGSIHPLLFTRLPQGLKFTLTQQSGDWAKVNGLLSEREIEGTLFKTYIEQLPVPVDPRSTRIFTESKSIAAEKPILDNTTDTKAKAAYLRRFSLSIFNGFFNSRVETFRELYGNAQFLPRFEVEYLFVPRLFISAAFSWISASGSSPKTERKVDSRQTFTALGLGYRLFESASTALSLSAASAMLFFKEEVGSLSNEGSALGFDLGAEFSWRFYPAFAVMFKAGYNSASHEKNGYKTELGGFWLGLGIRGSF